MLFTIIKVFFYLVYLFFVDVFPVLAVTFFLIYKFSRDRNIKYTIMSLYVTILNIIGRIVKLFSIEKYEKIKSYAYDLFSPYEDMKFKDIIDAEENKDKTKD